ncbi:toxin-antitoxin system YwqK family antitoxin [Stakelama pacifica]|uniref:Antitoxin component YwqK of YwqJK toxin-antitoxin module n=1 Tax=Stakelama pacifica TaxID=517720 RepID=A0A4R6FJG6_9SPHN|nr:toxin-antitoxin system YwqK family antitoxin [Stakelama pacifica]TDN81621.1 antitoxin component YwqK of YwqJK toxin-antitoxin module [Stakelama pacifica]GGO96072.1 hypothetical protein GCM10011329_21730 [Stakelama pacifica]
MTLTLVFAALLVASAPSQERMVIPNHESVAESDLCRVEGRPRFSGIVELRRDDGMLMREVGCEGGEKQGRDRQFYENGTLMMERHWQAGALDGAYRSWFPDGAPKEAWTYGPKGLEGDYRIYHENGRLAARAQYRDGKRNGPYADYDKQGHLLERGDYRHGRADGTVVEYAPSGQAIKVTHFQMGRRTGIQALWSDTNGRLLRRYEYSPEGAFVSGYVWNVDGSLRRTTFPVDIPGYGRGLKTTEYEGCLTRTIVQSGTDDPARLAEIGYSFTPDIYKLETLRRGDAIVERVEAYNHKLLSEPIHRDKACGADESATAPSG